MNFIAVLNYEQLDNGMFLTAFARALSGKKARGIILHEDSEYTERLIQTGMMREDAVNRSIKDLNHRLVALFADQGVSTVGLNGYQKSLVKTDGKDIQINKKEFEKLPEYPMLLISSMALHSKSGLPVPVSVSDLAFAVQHIFAVEQITIFSIKDTSNMIREDLPKKIRLNELDQRYLSEYIPKAFHSSDKQVYLTTADQFGAKT